MQSGLESSLLDRIASLEEQIVQLQEVLTPSSIDIPVEWRLTGSEAAVFACLAARKMATKVMIHHALYSGKLEFAEPKIVDVFICKMRRKLKPFGIVIDTYWGEGYGLQNRQQYLRDAA